MKNFIQLLLFGILAFGLQAIALGQMAKEQTMMKDDAAPTVIQLNQDEGVYTTTSLQLVPGNYIFEVTNREVDKDLGFYLQDTKGEQVDNSGLAALVGKDETSRTGVVTLTEGDYQYSCPLNPTPHYGISVGEPRVISLTQTPGVYEQSGLNLSQGYYVFEVTNLNVDKEVGFLLQGADGEQVEGSGLSEIIDRGETSRSRVIYLAPGDYQYSCPLNPTPHYTLTIK